MGLELKALQEFMTGLGEPAWRGGQLFEGLYHHRWTSWSQFTVFGKELRARLEAAADLRRTANIVESVTSADGSSKHAFRLEDGLLVEGVYMPYFVRGSALCATPSGPRAEAGQSPASALTLGGSKPSVEQEAAVPQVERVTLCLSSQVGCAMGCSFCATGQMGILRNLLPGEIVSQVLAMLDQHGHRPPVPVNLVFMGMGEPMHNLEHVMTAFRVLTAPTGLAIPPRRITLSTVGLVSGIERLAGYKPRPRLAVSLNATTDAARSRIMPVNRAWGLDRLAEALGAFPLERGERITLEYLLLKGITDSLEDGQRLAAFARRFPSKVNLIPFNPLEAGIAAEAQEGPGNDGFQPSDEARVETLCALLANGGTTVSVRRSRGQDVAGACGQLVRRGC
jgi:23S rRNA (adenine2503-C2)-methyltransferase